MPQVGFVVEGRSLEMLFRESLCPWLRQEGVVPKVINAGGRSRLIRDAFKHLNALRISGCTRVFFVLDQESDPCPPATAQRLGNVRSEPDVTVCVVARTLEAWLLADRQAILKATGQPFGLSPTDFLSDPVTELKGLFFKKTQTMVYRGRNGEGCRPPLLAGTRSSQQSQCSKIFKED